MLQKQLATDSSMIPHAENLRKEQMRKLADTGAFRVHAVQEKSAVENYTKALQKQDVTFRGWTKSAKLRNDVLKEQYRLQRASVMGWREDGMGRMTGDMIIPRDVPERLGSFRKGLADVRAGQVSLGTVLNENRMRLGLWTQGVQSASKNMVNWGKNTQWAGRQMMVGLTLPFAALAAGTGALAYQLDKEMVRVLKVYDYATSDIESEGERLKQATMDTARDMANAYGQSAQDTIGIVAELAAVGMTGVDLQKSAEVVSRAAMLGELDRQDAIKTTISLQTVFNQNTEQLAETFDYLNGLENATSLSMRDMTVAIPKLAGVVKSLGGDYRDMGIMMTATKSAGLDAAEGANMLKTVMFRAVSPYGKGKETFAAKTNVDLTKLVESTEGKAIPTFLKMGEAMKNLSNIERNAVLKDVFGVYQGSKGGQFIEEMLQIGDATSQVGRAAEMSGKSVTELREIADREVARMQQSASGQFKIALESIKVELADIGEPFLKIATTIIRAVTKIFSAFNGLSDTKKQIILYGLAFLAIIGPIVMITGVMATLIGTVIKMGAAMLMAAARFRAVNADQMSATLLAKGSSAAFRDEATAAQLLSYRLGEISSKLTTLTGNAAAAKMALGQVVPAAGVGMNGMPGYATVGLPGKVVKQQDKNGRDLFYSVGDDGRKTRVSSGVGAAVLGGANERTATASRAAAAGQDLADGTEKAKRNIATMNTGLASGVGMMMMMVGGTNQWIFGLGMVLMMLPVIQMMLSGIAGTKIWGSISAGIGKMYTGLKGKVAPLVAKLGPNLAALGPAMGPLGIALVAAGAAFAVFHYKAKKAREEMEALVSSSKGIAGAMDVELLEPGKHIDPKTGEKSTGAYGIAQQFKKENQEATKELVKLGAMADKTLLKNRVLQIGFDIYKATGDAQKAHQAVRVALMAAGNPAINIDVNFADENWRNSVQSKLLDGLAEAAAGAYESGGRFDLGMDDKVKVQLEEQANSIAVAFGQLKDGVIDLPAFQAQIDAVLASYSRFGEKLIAEKRKTFSNDTVDIIEKHLKKPIQDLSDAEIASAMITNDAFYKNMNTLGSGAVGLASDFRGLKDTWGYLSEATVEATGTQNLAGIETKDMSTLTRGLKEENNDAAASTNKFAGAAEDLANGLEDGLAPSLESVEEKTKKFVDAQKNAMSSVWGSVLEFAAEGVENQHEAAIEGMEAAGKRKVDALESEAKQKDKEFDAAGKAMDARHKKEDKAFTSRWDDQRKAIEGQYDTRVKKIEDTMEAEKKAEEQREKMFEAEKNRIQRLSEMFNQNIDFNVAVNAGDMDEAAKIGNDMRAQEQQWALDDAMASGTDAQGVRDAANQAKITGINDAKTKRLEALKEEEEIAKEALQRRQTAEKEALDAEKERYRESVDARKQAEEAKTKAAVDSSKKSYEARKKALEQELAVLKAFIPKNETELAQHTARIEAAYGRHGFALDTKSKEWSEYVARAMKNATNTAAQEMATSTKWDELGRTVGDQLGQNIMGMNFADFIKWMQTGELPTPPVAAAAPKKATGSAARNDAAHHGLAMTPKYTSTRGGVTAHHSGGAIGSGGSGRAGRPLSAGLYADEVPIIAQKGEYMMQRSAVDRIGMDNLHAMNQGAKGPDKTGRMHKGGLVSSFGGMVQSLMQRGLAKAMMVGASRKVANIANGRESGVIPPKVLSMMQNGSTVGGEGNYGPQFKFAAPGLPAGVTAAMAGGMMDPNASLPAGFLPGSYQSRGAYKAHGGAVTGDVQGLAMEFLRRLAAWSGAVGKPYNVGSGYRSMAEQQYLYNRWMNRVPGQAPAAPPGRSNHNFGLASDGPHWGHLSPERFGLRYPMSYEPWHVEPNNARGMRAGVPGLKVGGTVKYDNTIANLHKNESVLTAPLSAQLERGIANLDSGGINQYDITMDFRGAVIREDVDIEKAVAKVLNAHESKMGRKRVIR